MIIEVLFSKRVLMESLRYSKKRHVWDAQKTTDGCPATVYFGKGWVLGVASLIYFLMMWTLER
jgi:hypothetical protein